MSTDPLPSGSTDALVPSETRTPTRPSTALDYLSKHHPTLIPVHIVSSHAYVWRVSDVSTLRDTYHICGLLTGTLPLIPQQNAFLGLPLQLFREEVTFLMRKRAIILIADEESFDLPAPEDGLVQYMEAYQKDRKRQEEEIVRKATQGKTAQIEKLIREQHKASVAHSRTDATSVVGSLSEETSASGTGVDKQDELLRQALEKRLQREERRRMANVEAHLQQQQQQAQDPTAESSGSRSTPIDEELGSFVSPDRHDADAAASASKASTTQLFPTDDGQPTLAASTNQTIGSTRAFSHLTIGSALESPFPTPWYRPHLETSPGSGSSRPRTHTLLSTARASGLWTYPRTRADRARCAVFEDLQARGYFLGLGLRFGGDFVVYPGDPLRFHSHFTATAKLGGSEDQEGEEENLSAMELVANGRLGTAVKKAHLVSFAHDVRPGIDAVASGKEGATLREQWEREDDVEYKWGNVEHLSLTWAGFGT